jgi:predicted TIM-barrel fold metal-dependent hydrolase
MSKQIEDAVRRGARGLKILKEFGLEVKTKSGELLKIDDPRLNPMWSTCGRLGIPVAIHVGDPDAFFEPIDAHNERYDELSHFPEWSFYGNGFPSKRSLVDALARVFEAFPGTTFLSLHVGNWPENLDYVSEILKKHSNVFVDLGAREAELGRQPNRARKFFLEFQDRIVFGTDMRPEPTMYHNYFRWLETDDDYFEYYGYPLQGRWKIYGLNLPAPVLKKIYSKNAEKIFAKFKPAR